MEVLEEFLKQYKDWKQFGLNNGLLTINELGRECLTVAGIKVRYDKQQPILRPGVIQQKFL